MAFGYPGGIASSPPCFLSRPQPRTCDNGLSAGVPNRPEQPLRDRLAAGFSAQRDHLLNGWADRTTRRGSTASYADFAQGVHSPRACYGDVSPSSASTLARLPSALAPAGSAFGRARPAWRVRRPAARLPGSGWVQVRQGRIPDLATGHPVIEGVRPSPESCTFGPVRFRDDDGKPPSYSRPRWPPTSPAGPRVLAVRPERRDSTGAPWHLERPSLFASGPPAVCCRDPGPGCATFRRRPGGPVSTVGGPYKDPPGYHRNRFRTRPFL